jgi:hypothetical protein
MIPKSGNRFSEKIMLGIRYMARYLSTAWNMRADSALSMIPKSMPSDLIRGWDPVSRLREACFGGRSKVG